MDGPAQCEACHEHYRQDAVLQSEVRFEAIWYGEPAARALLLERLGEEHGRH